MAGPTGNEQDGTGAAPQGPVPQDASEPSGASEPSEPTGDTTAPAASAARRPRMGLVMAVTLVAIVLVGGAAFAAVRFWPSPGVNPAERLPDSALFYAEINLDPGSEQTRRLRSLAETFDALDDVSDPESLITELLDDLDLDGVESGDLTGWLGTRAAVASWSESIDDGYFAVALASRDDTAAEEGLGNIHEALDGEFGYVVDDGLAVLTFAASDAQDRAESLITEGRAAPLAESERFRSDMEWLGDHILVFWVNDAEFSEYAEEAMTLAPEFGELDVDAFSDLYTAESSVLGVRAAEDAIEAHFRADSDSAALTGQDWRGTLGGLRSSQVAALFQVPDLTPWQELSAELFDELDSGGPPELANYTRGQWDYERAMTDEEHAEYTALLDRWTAGDLVEGDPDFDRLIELDEQFLLFGTQGEYDEWAADSGESEQHWRFENALTLDEFTEFVVLEAAALDDALSDEDLDRFYQLDARLYGFGVVTDYEFYEPEVDVAALVEEMTDMLSGATLTVAAADLLTEPDVGLSVEFTDGPADRVLDLPIPDLDQFVDELGDDLVFDGPTLTYGDLEGSGTRLADHSRFEEAFAGMPEEAVLAVFVDVAALTADAEEQEEWLEPISTISLVAGETSGMLRVLVDQPE